MGEGSNFSLVKIEGKPLEKLIEVVSQGIGTLYRPSAIRKEAKAEAFKIGVIAKAQALANAEGKLIDLETFNIIEQKILHQQVKKQNNIDKIIDVAIDQVSQESEVSSEKVDPDWTTRFFNIAEDVSNEEMQQLWGRILSGEVKQPGSFSLRALELLKNLTKEEAEIFTKFAHLKISMSGNDFIPFTEKEMLYNQFNIPYKDILLMAELGLIITSSDLALLSKGDNTTRENFLENGEIGIYITKADSVDTSVKIISFTKTGSELSNLITVESNEDYIHYVCKSFTTPSSKIKIGKVIFDDNGKGITDLFDYEP